MLSRESEDALIVFMRMCFKDDKTLGIDVRWKEVIFDECLGMLGGDPYQEGLHGERIVKMLAEPYKGHPDFRSEWLL